LAKRKPEDPVTAFARATVKKRGGARVVRLACARHLRDRKRKDLFWDAAKAQWAIEFFSHLRHSKGPKAGKPFILEPWQAFVIGSLFGWRTAKGGPRRYRVAYVEVPRKNGKALDVQTSVLTPEGWRQHGDLRVGDRVFAADGQPVVVTAVGEPHVGPAMSVRFSDGEAIIAHEHHEWLTERTWYTGRKKGSRQPLPAVETATIASTLRGGARGDFVHRIKVTAPLECPERQLPIPPYTLGAWLGDGHSAAGRITGIDEPILAMVAADGFEVLRKPRALWSVLGLQARLRSAGLLRNKHIPPAYLVASRTQRLALLRGLIDTDGHVTKAGQVEFVSVSERLARDFILLARTLGLKPTLSTDRARLRGKDCGARYRVQLWARDRPVAGLSRKAKWLRYSSGRALSRTIVGVESVGITEVNCIEVEGGIYLAGEGLIPTHNSTLSAGLALLLAFFDDEPGSEVYCAATKRDQARIVFEEAQRMVKASPSLKKRITSFVGNLHIAATAQKLQPLGADADSMDGLNIHAAIVDELHAHKTRAMVDVLETATGARTQPLIFYITTAGYDRHSVCWERHAYTERLLDGTLEDDASFGFIVAADEKDDWRKPATWANPNLGVSVSQDDLERKVRRAIEIPAEQNAFRRLHLNQWTEQETRWLDAAVWNECAGPVGWQELREAMRGETCFLGMDLASSLDVSAVVGWFPERNIVVPWFWIPADRMKERVERDRVPYDQWTAQEAVFATPGEVTDQDEIQRYILETISKEHQVREIAYDAWNATQLAVRLGAAGATMVTIAQTISMMSEAVKRIEELVVGRKLQHGGHPVLSWMASNCETQSDSYGNRKLRKPERSEAKRVDGMVALAMAVSRELRAEQPEGPSIYDQRRASGEELIDAW
jgi:phage terminase large subunit-like protein